MPARFTPSQLLGTLALTALSAVALAADPVAQRVSFTPPSSNAITGPALLDKTVTTIPSGASGSRYVFSAPPYESASAAAETYAPVAEYLTRVTGKQVVYRHPANWIAYQAEMRRGEYDLVFDGPHLNAWRASHLRHNILVKAPGDHNFVVVVKKDNAKVQELKQLVGRAICGMSPPDLATLAVLKEFDNPLRQPIIRNAESWDAIYTQMQTGGCTAAILPAGNLARFDASGARTRAIFTARGYPGQALSAGPRVSVEDQVRISRALISPEARNATRKLRDLHALSGDFQPVAKDEYAGVAGILKDSWGYQ